VTDGISRRYGREKARAGGAWYCMVSRASGPGTWSAVIDDDADHVVHGYSVQKLAVAVAVMDKVDRGLLRLDQRVELDAGSVLRGTGSFHLHTVWGDSITIANVLTAMLLVSDNTAVRLCGLVAPALEINEVLAAKGFAATRVEPDADPHRFFLGTTTPREVTGLLTRLADGTLLAPASCAFLLSILRWTNGYMDGIRRNMSSGERARIATKCGADFNALGAARHEAGVMFSADGSPALAYAFFAEALGELDNYGATHPAVEAHAVLGRTLLNTVDGRAGS
jgi:beta-lactamase class A